MEKFDQIQLSRSRHTILRQPPGVSTLNVLLYGELIGTITNVGSDRTLFAFTEDYIRDSDRPILSLGFKDSFGELITNFRPVQTKLMPFFSNLLPEGAMRDYLGERAGVNSEREFFLLWVLGQDLPGAITVKPADGEVYLPHINGPIEGDEDREKQVLRFSLAGIQLKFSAVKDARGGLTIPVNGVGGSWIVKLPSGTFKGVPENEFSMMELARQIGMDVPETGLYGMDKIKNIPEGIEQFGDKAFAVKRFDRNEDGVGIHMEDFAQIFGVYPRDKYKKASMCNIAEVIGIEGQESDTQEFIRRLVFNILIGNGDMHLKNWSLIYRDSQTASIAPAYDFVSTVPYIADETNALKVGRSKRFDTFNLDELSYMAAKACLPEKLVLETACETVGLFMDAWTKEKCNLELSGKVIKAIEKHLTTLPIIEEAG